eukprot:14250862-Heterocapsa_arctica.AAC.1
MYETGLWHARRMPGSHCRAAGRELSYATLGPVLRNGDVPCSKVERARAASPTALCRVAKR